MAIVTINNIAEFRTVAAEYGVAVPAKQGRPPAVKLAQAIVAKGDTINPTDYFDGRTEYKTLVPKGSVGKSEYRVTGTRELIKDGEVVLKKNGEARTMPFTKKVLVGDVRAFLADQGNAGARGRISGEGFAAFLSAQFNGANVTITNREKVGAAVAAESVTETVSEPSEGESIPAAE